MSPASYGAKSRRPVYTGNRRIPGLFERTLADGATVYDVSLRLGGKMRRHRLEAHTKTDAIAELRSLQTDYSRGETFRSPAAAPTVTDLAADYLAHLEARVGHRDPRRRYSARTVELYRQRLDQHICPELGRRPADSLTVADIRRLVDALGRKKLAPSTVTSTLNILSGLLRFGIKAGAVDRNPVRDLDRDDRPGVARLTEPRYLTADELGQLLAKVGDTFRPVAATCTFAALRISEALGLRWRDVDLKAATITVSGQLGAGGERVPAKTEASAATLPMVPALKRELRKHRSRQASRNLQRVQPDALVFVTATGKPQARRNALRAVQAASDAAGLNADGREPVGLHDLRHSYVALALGSGASIAETAALARHASPRVTLAVYGGIVEQGRDAAAAKLIAKGFGK